MKAHRRLASLLALIALVFSFAETARASTCELLSPAPAQHHSGVPGHAPEHSGSHNPSMPNCPLSAAGQLGCAASVSLPARYTTVAAPEHEVTALFAGDVVLPHSVRTTAIFHPPRF